MSAYTLSFSEIDKASGASVGGKGANLGEMARAGFPVPEGFCVTTTAYQAFIKDVAEKLYSRLNGMSGDDLEAVKAAGEDVRKMLSNVDLPAGVAEAVLKKHAELGEQRAYAVRSSATAEDLPNASFAGQQDTYLNIIGKKALLEHVKRCFISLYTDRAILYRIQNGFDHRQVSLSVVVQQMVLPETSGILFTADPISQHRGICSIDASFGLGEALVSGLVSADLYKIDKASLTILEKKISEKKLAVYPVEGGGTQEKKLPKDQSEKQALSDDLIRQLTVLGQQIENHYGTPQDIEWAVCNGKINITQSRPITSLYPQPNDPKRDTALHAYACLSHLQVMTAPIPPLGVSIWRQIPVFANDSEGNFRYLFDVGGRLYADVSPLLRHPISRKIVTKVLGIADQLMQAGVIEITSRPEFLKKGERFNLLKLIASRYGLFVRIPFYLFLAKTEGAVEQANQQLTSYVASVQKDLANTSPSLEDKLNLSLAKLTGFFTVASAWLPKLVAGMLAQRLLYLLAGKENKPAFDDLERGVVGNVVTEMNRSLGEMADTVSSSKALLGLFFDTSKSAEERLKQAKTVEGSEPFFDQWHAFLKNYGERCPGEIDASRTRWNEDPSSLLETLEGVIMQMPAGVHQQAYRALLETSNQAAEQICANVPLWKRPLSRHFLRVSNNCAPLRDHHKLLMIRLLAQVKGVVKEVAANFVEQGQIAKPEDIWFLTVPEVREALKTGAVFKELVEQRRTKHKVNATRTPPRLLLSTGEVLRPKLSKQGMPAGALAGSAASAGVYEGIAAVLLTPDTRQLKPGEILIAPYTDPGWTPLFVNAKALVAEVGGLMTHGSVVAREYGIPAVVGLDDATRLIKSGDHIRVNGTEGYVEILERAHQ